MTPTEKVCLTCGGFAEDPNKAKNEAKARFRTVIKYFMFATAALTVGSLFVDTGVTFMAGMAVTIVLFLVQNSAQEMLIDRDQK